MTEGRGRGKMGGGEEANADYACLDTIMQHNISCGRSAPQETNAFRGRGFFPLNANNDVW